MKKVNFFLFVLVFCFRTYANNPVADSILAARGEIQFYFVTKQKGLLNELTFELSIDKVISDTVFCYANKKEFEKFITRDIHYTIVEPDPLKILKSAKNVKSAWNSYPSYSEYISLMGSYEKDYPQLCQLVEIGESVDKRKLLAVKISDNVSLQEQEPAFFYTSSMHGDELTGYVLMLRLIDYLLSNYDSNTEIKNLIDSLEIWVNPLANPDGTYYSSNNDVFSAKRSNSNNIDLNRNFPDVLVGDHPDGNDWQPEVVSMMDFMKKHQFTMSANFHGGTEVVNYPWDHTYDLHADDEWYQLVSAEYANYTHLNSYDGYMNPVWSSNGITNGADWYVVYGGRQDYANSFVHCREVTIEMSNQKTVPEDSLENMWLYNRDALLNYMKQCTYGIRGDVIDITTKIPVRAKIELLGHDKDNSFVYSSSANGGFYRLVKGGTYNMNVSAVGYKSVNISNISIADFKTKNVKVELEKSNSIGNEEQRPSILIYPNPANDYVFLKGNDNQSNLRFLLYALNGQLIREIGCNTEERIIDVSTITDGVYFYAIKTGQEIISKDILVINHGD